MPCCATRRRSQFYENEADHWFTIGHENAHSLGPKEGTEALGKYKSIIEENKADMVSLAMLDVLTELAESTDHSHQPSSLGQSIVDLGLDHKKIQVASVVGLTASMRSEQNHTRRTAGLGSESLPGLLDGRL